MNDQLVDAGDEEDVRRERKKYKLERQREIQEMRKLLDEPGNRALLWRFFQYCKIFDSLPPMDIGPLAMTTGIRNAGIWMLNEVLEAKPNMLTIMKQEAVEREKR
jgi:hypothetical protein